MPTPERKAQFRDICKRIASMPEADRTALAARLPGLANCEGHSLSAYNCCLIAAQSPIAATIVGGFKQWICQGRVVKKGEHGLMIWFPRGQKKADSVEPRETEERETQSEDVSFLIGTVFDISQTTELLNPTHTQEGE